MLELRENFSKYQTILKIDTFALGDWFEDNILQDFFNLSTKDGVEIQKVRK